MPMVRAIATIARTRGIICGELKMGAIQNSGVIRASTSTNAITCSPEIACTRVWRCRVVHTPISCGMDAYKFAA